MCRCTPLGPPELNTDLHWLPVLAWADCQVLPCQAVSTTHQHLLSGRRPALGTTLGFKATGPPCSPLEWAAKHCFWQLGTTLLLNVAKTEGVDLPTPQTDLGLLAALVNHCLPGLYKQALCEILALRSSPQRHQTAAPLDPGLVAEVCPEDRDEAEAGLEEPGLCFRIWF